MHGTAGVLDAVFQSLMLRVKSRKSREQRGVDVQNALRKFADEISTENAHVAGEADQIDFVLAEFGDQLTVVNFTVESLRCELESIEPTIARRDDTGNVGTIGDDHGNLSVEAAGANGIGDSEEVRASAGKENAESLHDREFVPATTAPSRSRLRTAGLFIRSPEWFICRRRAGRASERPRRCDATVRPFVREFWWPSLRFSTTRQKSSRCPG